MTNLVEITNHLVTTRSAMALQQYVGPGKQYSYEDVAIAIDVDERTVESWVLGRAQPYLYKWLKLCGLLGPEFANQYLRLVALDGVDRIDPTPVTDAQLNAESAQLVAVFSQAAVHIRNAHSNKPERVMVVRRAHEVMTDWLAQNDMPQGRPN